MRRVAIVLADLFVDDAARTVATIEPPALPALESLLRFATLRQPRSDWRDWLQRTLALAPLPAAATVAAAREQFGDGAGRDAARDVWLATPVSLEAQLNHVRLREQGLLTLSAAEQSALTGEFARTFGPQLSLSATSPREFLLRGLDVAAAETIDPARLLGRDIGPSLPRGAAAARLRSFASELELWLHDQPINQERRKRYVPDIATLWLWGAGVPTVATQCINSGPSTPITRVFADDAYAGSCAQLAGLPDVAATPVSWAALQAHATAPSAEQTSRSDIVVLWPMTATASGLATLESAWFAPLQAALAAGQLDEVLLVANDRLFEIRHGARWQFWRKRVSWIDRLRCDQS
ncbi:MAG TPA: hypothetical protein P5528_14155 [Steroidobacteraceae bacterium]|nr:hypothetical protein [Steroidobacteraceae bacterium]HRX90581.1 hypothetical protein [Steroidobacteraceae bacterium]